MYRATITPFIVLLSVFALTAWGDERTPIILERARSLKSFEENGVRWQELHGDVLITKDSLTVTCQNATYYPDSGLLIFRDNVEFRDPHRTLFADEVVYHEFTEEVDARHRVRIYQQDTLSAMSRTARYYDRLKQGHLFNSVQIREEQRRLLLTGDYGLIEHERKYGRVVGNPVLTERDSTNRIVATVRGDTIEYFGDVKTARVRGNVEIVRDSLLANGSDLVYLVKDHVAVLTGSPEAHRGADDIQGDTLRLFVKDERIERVEVIGHAVATNPADSGFSEPRNRLEGKRMTLWIEDGRLARALVEGTATATYHVRDQGKKQGLNVTSGDRLRISFNDGRISYIRVEGGTEGEYTPQRLVEPIVSN